MPDLKKLAEIIEPEAKALGFDLVRVAWFDRGAEGSDEPTLQVMAERPDTRQLVIDDCAARGFRQMVAVIGDSENVGSIGLHSSLGFRQVGTMKAVGLKFGQWVDVVTMQRALGEGERTLPGA